MITKFDQFFCQKQVFQNSPKIYKKVYFERICQTNVYILGSLLISRFTKKRTHIPRPSCNLDHVKLCVKSVHFLVHIFFFSICYLHLWRKYYRKKIEKLKTVLVHDFIFCVLNNFPVWYFFYFCFVQRDFFMFILERL